LIRFLSFFLIATLPLFSADNKQKKEVPAATAQKPSATPAGVERHYYIAAEDVTWDFAPSGRNLIHNSRLPALWIDRTKWPKQRFIEYTDDTFTTKKPQPMWLGLLGPIIRGEVGDTIYVHFLNRATGTHSIHSHGVLYDKDSEGADYSYSGKGGRVQQGEKFIYKWVVTPESGPQDGEPSSRAWLYHGHVDEPEETNAGLIGPIVITAKGKANPDGLPKDVEKEFVVLFMMFDQSPLPPLGTRRSQLQFVLPEFEFSAMNGYFFGNLQGLVMNEGDRVRWHTMAMGSETDVHTPHWHGNRVALGGHTSDVRMLMPAMTDTVDMVAGNPGTWMFQCHVSDHMDEGMMTYYTVLPKQRACPVEYTGGNIEPDGTLDVSIANRASAGIRSSTSRVEAVLGWHRLNSLVPSEFDTQQIATSASASKQIKNSFVGAKETMGYVVWPLSVTFDNGEKWQPRYRGECAKTFFRPGKGFEMPVLPPDGAHEHDDVED
jgi:manganese oxidase